MHTSTESKEKKRAPESIIVIMMILNVSLCHCTKLSMLTIRRSERKNTIWYIPYGCLTAAAVTAAKTEKEKYSNHLLTV